MLALRSDQKEARVWCYDAMMDAISISHDFISLFQQQTLGNAFEV